MAGSEDIVLVIGGGGREHAITRYISLSAQVRKIYVAPGNSGTESVDKAENVPKCCSTKQEITSFCTENNVDLVIICPEGPLADGLSDHLRKENIQVFGPSRKATYLESDKSWAKDFMNKYSIPTAEHKTFNLLDDAVEFVETCPWSGIVIKVSGLAGGKGVFMSTSKENCIEILNSQIRNGSQAIKDAASKVILEEQLFGYEMSEHVLSDGACQISLPRSQDHKKRSNGDTGPNTGGMGAIAPLPFEDETLDKMIAEIREDIFKGLKKEKTEYTGILYIGFMVTKNGPKVLEFNCRFGDPETQVILPLIGDDLYRLLKGSADKCLFTQRPNKKKIFCCGVSVVISDYPRSCAMGYGNTILGLEEIEDEADVEVFHAGAKYDDKKNLVTSGGRVLTVCAKAATVELASIKATEMASKIRFNSRAVQYMADYRKDIGFQARMLSLRHKAGALTYESAGVSIEKGYDVVDGIKKMTKKAKKSKSKSKPKAEDESAIGGFGAIFDMKKQDNKDPMLVSGTDGVGTKLKIAQDYGKHSTIGQDLVAMCVNDIVVCGAEPLFFLDYFATGKLEVSQTEEVVSGIVEACRLAKCELAGGETAEMPGMYGKGEYDLAGFVVGAVDRKNILPKKRLMKPNDLLVAVRSSGLHSNGFSLVRKLVRGLELPLESPAPFDPMQNLGPALLEPTFIYTDLLPIIKSDYVLGAAHITGGGLSENIKRAVPASLCVQIDRTWTPPPVFLWLLGNGVSWTEMLKTFNCGVGIVLVAKREPGQGDDAILKKINKKLPQQYGQAFALGTLVNSITPFVCTPNVEQDFMRQTALLHSQIPGCFPPRPQEKRVAVLISGEGTNLQALIEHTRSEMSAAKIVLVVSNKHKVGGLTRAEKAGIPVLVREHQNYKTRQDFEKVINEALQEDRVDYVCLAGFMRILSPWFVNKWNGKIINLHPSLLPAFKGKDAMARAMAAGVKVAGCSVHFVNEEVDCGTLIAQEAFPILPEDTLESITVKLKEVEHRIYPTALESVVRGHVKPST